MIRSTLTRLVAPLLNKSLETIIEGKILSTFDGITAPQLAKAVFGDGNDPSYRSTWAAIRKLEQEGKIYRSYRIDESKATEDDLELLNDLLFSGNVEAWETCIDSMAKQKSPHFYPVRELVAAY